METFSALFALCEGNPGGFPSQWPVTQSFDGFFDLRLNKRLSKRSICQWFVTPLRSLWHHCNAWWYGRDNSNNTFYPLMITTNDNDNSSNSAHNGITMIPITLKLTCHFDEIPITGCAGSWQFDNFQCRQWWKFRQNEVISVSVNGNDDRKTGQAHSGEALFSWFTYILIRQMKNILTKIS